MVSATQSEADRTLDVLLEHGINHLDVAASYGDGAAEKRMGPWMSRHRSRFFLATKTGKRSYSEAWDDLRSSLERLRVDSVDLIQLHNLTDPEEWEQVFAAGGALEALIEARSRGLARFIGVTGHGYTVAEMHLRSLERFAFDSVLLPYNHLMTKNPDYSRRFDELQKRCEEKQVAVQTIKSLARMPWTGKRTHSTWYRPLSDDEAIATAVGWVLGNPDVFLISPGDLQLLPGVLDAASRAAPRPGEGEMEQLESSQGIEPIFRGREFIL